MSGDARIRYHLAIANNRWKHPKTGHNACFTSRLSHGDVQIQAFGIADGGNCDGSLVVSAGLMASCEEVLSKTLIQNQQIPNPKTVLKSAFNQSTETGFEQCSTALCAIFLNGLLRIVDVGRAGFIVISDGGKHCIRSRQQPASVYHRLDRGSFPEAGKAVVNFLQDSDHAEEYEMRLGENDMIIAATDGFWQYQENESMKFMSKDQEETATETVSRLASAALESQRQHGGRDDIVVVVGKMQTSSRELSSSSF